MAGIDKTFVKTWEDYVAIKDWAWSVGRVKDDFGNIFYPYDWLSEYSREEFDESIRNQKSRYKEYYSDPQHVKEAKEWLGNDWEPNPEGEAEVFVWNTPHYFDVWLIRECPLKIIQDRLKQQYGSEYSEIRNRRSEYDTFKKPAASSHFKIFALKSFPRVRVKNLWLSFQIIDSDGWRYNDETGKWSYWLECKEFNTDTATIKGPITRRKLKRLIIKWGFPAGIKLDVYSNYGHLFKIYIRK